MKYLMPFIFLLAFSTVSLSQQFKPNESKPTVVPTPLIIVDGKTMPPTMRSKTDTTKFMNTLDALNPSDIAVMEVIKYLDAIAKYGEAGRNGVVVITTRASLQRSKER